MIRKSTVATLLIALSLTVITLLSSCGRDKEPVSDGAGNSRPGSEQSQGSSEIDDSSHGEQGQDTPPAFEALLEGEWISEEDMQILEFLSNGQFNAYSITSGDKALEYTGAWRYSADWQRLYLSYTYHSEIRNDAYKATIDTKADTATLTLIDIDGHTHRFTRN